MKQTVNLKLKMSEIIYDIQNKTYLTGRSLENGTNHSHVANLQANDDDENAAQVLRSVTMAVGILRNRIAEYLEGGQGNAVNDSLGADDDISMGLSLPSNFNPAVAQTIGEAAHEFIVAKAVAEWFAITAKGETSDYNALAENALKVMEEALCKRSRPVRGE